MSKLTTKRSRFSGMVATSVVVILAAAFIATLAFLYLKSKGDEPEVTAETPTVMDITKKAVATGSIVPRREVMIKPRVSGIVKELFVKPGDLVKEGALIAEIKIVPNMAALTQAESAVHKARIAVTHAEAELRRAERLGDGGLLSQRALSERKLDYDLRKAEVAAASSQLQVVREGASKTTDDTANTRVRSTVSGTVLEVPVEQGGSVIESNNFNEGTTIAAVADMGDMIFQGRIDEAEVDKIRTGMEVVIKIGAIDERRFAAKLEYIAPKGKVFEGGIQFEIKAALERVDDALIRAGYSANAEIVLARKEKVLAIRETLLSFEGDKPYVQIEVAPDRFERRDLELGISDGIHIEVVGGLDAQARILLPEVAPSASAKATPRVGGGRGR